MFKTIPRNPTDTPACTAADEKLNDKYCVCARTQMGTRQIKSWHKLQSHGIPLNLNGLHLICDIIIHIERDNWMVRKMVMRICAKIQPFIDVAAATVAQEGKVWWLLNIINVRNYCAKVACKHTHTHMLLIMILKFIFGFWNIRFGLFDAWSNENSKR